MSSSDNKVTLYMPKDLVRRARAKAIAQGTSLSAVVREFLREWVKDPPAAENEE